MDRVDDQQLLLILGKLFEEHGVNLRCDRGWLHCAEGPAITVASRESSRSERGVAVVMTIDFALPDRRLLSESYPGRGQTQRDALADATRAFISDALHPILHVFYNKQPGPELCIEGLEIAGQAWQLIAGPMAVSRLGSTDQLELPAELFSSIERAMTQCKLTHNEHWFTSHVGRLNGEFRLGEARFDNDDWPEGAAALRGFAWPDFPGYYEMRNFSLLRRVAPVDVPQLPESQALERGLDIVVHSWRTTEAEDATVYQRLIKAGVASDLAERLIVFSPMAFAALYLRPARIPRHYQIADSEGVGGPECPLASEPVYVQALARAGAAEPELLHRIAQRSSFYLVAQELMEREPDKAGQAVDGLEFSPPVVFLSRFAP